MPISSDSTIIVNDIIISYRNSQEPLDMTTTTTAAGNSGTRAPAAKERASVIIGHRTPLTTTTTGGMSDPVIDEHFRRSLGKDYMNVFAPAAVAQREQQQAIAATAAEPPAADGDNSGLSGTCVQLIVIKNK